MDEFEKELKLGFLEEAEQCLTDVEQSFLALETDPHNEEHINKIFRLAHNLKGSSKAVGFEQLGQFTHQFESFVLRIKNNELVATAAVISMLLKTVDFIKVMIDGYKVDLDATFEFDALLSEIQHFQEPAAGAEPVETEHEHDPAHEETFMPVPAATAAAATPVAAHQPAQAAPSHVKHQNVEESIRVAINKVEKLLNSVGEMVILQSVLSQKFDENQNPSIKKTIHQLGKVTKEIQDISMGLRMVPIKPTFQKMQRIVRDTSQDLSKDVLLVLQGEETELDKTVLENVNDPLVHLICNSVDHGIEKPEVRVARGKPAQGKVELKAFHRSGKLVIEVTDDGGGLDPQKLRNIAIAKGIVSEAVPMTDTECYKLIFAPGFSTKEQVTEVSGRGVGMDVVRTNIEKLGGEVQIESELLKGTTFRIILPLTLAIVDAMVVTVNSQKYVIPLSHVHETLQPKANQLHWSTDLGAVLMLRGENLPLHRLGDFFGVRGLAPESEMIAIIVRSTKKSFALLVDDIIGQFQIVVKQLTPDLQGLKGVSGTTILGDGKPCIILEPQDLLLRKLTVTDLNKQNINPTNNKVHAA